MNLARIAAVLLCALSSGLQAQTVISNSNLVMPTPYAGGPSDANLSFQVWQNVAATDWTSAWFKYNLGQLTFSTENADEGSDWYVVHSGDLFTPAAIASDKFRRLVDSYHYTPTPPTFSVGADFYLGVSTGQGYIPFPNRTVYGWVHLANTNGALTMLGNAMSYNSPGIIVGTTTTVPEPAAPCLLAIISSAFAVRRRRK